jgi:hypothetical protein
LDQKFAFPAGNKVFVFGLPLIATTLELKTLEIAKDSTEVYANQLHGHKIFISTEISDDKQQDLKRQINWLMGIAQDNMNGSTEVIAEKVEIQVDYREQELVQTPTPFWTAIFYKIPIFHSEWITALLDNALINPRMSHTLPATSKIYAHFRLQPFEGLVACGDYIKAENRSKVKKLVEQNGGKYEDSLYGTSGVNLILVDVGQSQEKISQATGVAKTFKMQIASTEWLAKSVEAKKPVKFYLREKEDDAIDNTTDFGLMLDKIPHSTQIETPKINSDQPNQLENVVSDDIEVLEIEEAIANESGTPMDKEKNDTADNLSAEGDDSDHDPPPAKKARKSSCQA